jgi:SAM-dependent methyltransferase
MNKTAPFVVNTQKSESLSSLFLTVDKNRFTHAIRRLHKRFCIYANTSTSPLPAQGLILTNNIRTQSELYLPISEITSVFYQLYSDVLSYTPIYSSTPFHNAMSWADVFCRLPSEFQTSANPAKLLENLLCDPQMLIRFLFASFLPNRFYGRVERYHGQYEFIRKWIAGKTRVTRCLDAACGTGDGTYSLAKLLINQGFSVTDISIEGWTLEPLEVWVASHLRTVDSSALNKCITFRCNNLLTTTSIPTNHFNERFDLIVCNGLLGGPIINENGNIMLAVSNLVQLLSTGGLLLAANNFHGGWKQKCPQNNLRALFEKNGLKTFAAGEGIGGLKSY